MADDFVWHARRDRRPASVDAGPPDDLVCTTRRFRRLGTRLRLVPHTISSAPRACSPARQTCSATRNTHASAPRPCSPARRAWSSAPRACSPARHTGRPARPMSSSAPDARSPARQTSTRARDTMSPARPDAHAGAGHGVVAWRREFFAVCGERVSAGHDVRVLPKNFSHFFVHHDRIRGTCGVFVTTCTKKAPPAALHAAAHALHPSDASRFHIAKEQGPAGGSPFAMRVDTPGMPLQGRMQGELVWPMIPRNL